MTRVVIADDHSIILSGIGAILEDSEFEVAGAFRNGKAVLDAIGKLKPDMLVIDLAMPERSGIEILRWLRSRGDAMPVILLSADIPDQALAEALRLSVNGIVLKDGAQDMLLDCLRAVVAGRRWIDQQLIDKALELAVDEHNRPRNPFDSLTARERTVSDLVANGLRNREIARELGITEGTVKVYLHRIYEKLDVSSRTELALAVRDRLHQHRR